MKGLFSIVALVVMLLMSPFAMAASGDADPVIDYVMSNLDPGDAVAVGTAPTKGDVSVAYGVNESVPFTFSGHGILAEPVVPGGGRPGLVAGNSDPVLTVADLVGWAPKTRSPVQIE